MAEPFASSRPNKEPTILDLVFAGFNSRVAALDRQTGEIVWQWKSPKGRSSHVAVLLDGSFDVIWLTTLMRFGSAVMFATQSRAGLPARDMRAL